MKNKELFYLALAIGGAFLIHKFMMKGMTANKTSNPVNPSISPIPTTLNQSNIKTLALDLIQQSSNQENAITNVHSSNEYDIAKTYQTLYGKSISGMYKQCPTII
jgi:hypothetical protein